MKKIIVILMVIFGLTSCGSPKMDSELVKSMLVGYQKGVMAGIEIGDDWETVKTNIHEGWKVDEEAHQLIKSWDDFNYVILTVDLDSESKVWQISFTINGKEGNHLLIAELQNTLQKELNAKYRSENSESWDFKAPNGDDCGISMNLHKQEDSGSNSLTTTVFNLSPK